MALTALASRFRTGLAAPVDSGERISQLTARAGIIRRFLERTLP